MPIRRITGFTLYEALPFAPDRDRRLGPEASDEYDRLMASLRLPQSDQAPGASGKPTLVDGRGQRFAVYLDLDGDGQIRVGGKIIRDRWAAYSFGKNGKDEHGDGDDIASWKR